jgi:tetratricopeptide (TPR) repeat protein/class 3 adenylate cyclase
MEHHNLRDNSGKEKSGKFVFCLSIDMIGSTKAGLKFTTKQRDRFNIQVVNQIRPHLEKLGLTQSLVKFTGDGWLVMTDEPDELLALCCLATIMAHRFKEEISEGTGISTDRIPSLRLAIHSGRDIRVELPDGRKDWVGDSVRRAVMASAICYPNEILISESVRGITTLEFHVESVNIKERPKPLKWEEDIEPLVTLGGLKHWAAEGLETHECFVYMLNVIGKEKEAKALVDTMEREGIPPNVSTYNTLIYKAPDYKEATKWVYKMREAGIPPNVSTYNTLIYKAPDYKEATKWVYKMREAGIPPDIVTYSELVDKASGYDEARALVDTMREEGIQPNIFTYSALIKKAPDYDEAMALVDAMREESIQPNIFTYNTLIKKAPEYNEAMALMDTMREEGVQPDVFTYSELVDKALDYDEAMALVDAMREEGIQPDIFTYNTLIKKAPDYDEAMALVDTMREEGVPPDVFTYNTLIYKTSNYNEAIAWVYKMREAGIPPNVVTYSTLFSKDLSEVLASDLLKWYLAQKYHPSQPIQAAIASYRKRRCISQALHLALGYPHLPVARKLIREHEAVALSYFRTISDHDPQHPNAEYALGVALMELGKEPEAIPHLKKSQKLVTADARIKDIEERLRRIDRKLSNKR